jgi:hypothetical protein
MAASSTSQGNFPSHRFVEQAKSRFGLGDIDQDRIRLLDHKENNFSKNANEESVSGWKWIAAAVETMR